MIDTHCHLTDSAFETDLVAVLERANAAGITRCIVVADSLVSSEKGIALSQHSPTMLSAAIGVHPHHASAWQSVFESKLRELADESTVVAIGEIGLDYHGDYSPREKQRCMFEEQLLIAKDRNLPVVLHTREAYDDTLAILLEDKPPKLVWHCCTEKWERVQPFLSMGYSLSFGGIATYPNADDVRETIRRCPLDRLMLETDAPYLPPEVLRAKRGRRARNEPAYVREVAKCVAAVKGLSLEEVDRVTTENAMRFFGFSVA